MSPSTITLTVQSVTSSSNGGFIMKLQNKSEKTVETPFGSKTQTNQLTRYIKINTTAAKVGDNITADLSEFNEVQRPYEIKDPASPMNGKTVMLTWLQLK